MQRERFVAERLYKSFLVFVNNFHRFSFSFTSFVLFSFPFFGCFVPFFLFTFNFPLAKRIDTSQ